MSRITLYASFLVLLLGRVIQGNLLIEKCLNESDKCTIDVDYMNENCPGFCCKDVWSQEKCDRLKTRNRCEIKVAIVNCAFTCDQCCVDHNTICDEQQCLAVTNTRYLGRCKKTCGYCPDANLVKEEEEEPPICGLVMGDRIIGGKRASLGDYPWHVLLYNSASRNLCGGSIISNRWVLSAAHCILRSSVLDKWTGIAGLVDKSDYSAAKKLEFKKVIKHEKFDSRTYLNDISLFQTLNSIIFNDAILPVCLPKRAGRKFLDGDVFKVAGFGTIEPKGRTSSSILYQIQLPFVNEDTCDDTWWSEVWDSIVCAGGEQHMDSCRGDSGGGLVYENDYGMFEIVGIVSYGSPDCGDGKPAVHTKVSFYLDWINKVMNMYKDA